MRNIDRRAVLTSGFYAAASLAVPAAARAQSTWPAGLNTVTIVIPFAPGGASDIIGRLLADSLKRQHGVATVVEHVPGGAATVGMARVANGPVDGSQILILPISYVTTQYLMSQLPYQPERDLAPLVQLTRQPSLLCVKKDLPVDSVAELIAYAKERPGKLNYASAGHGTPAHLSAELFQSLTGTRMLHVPYTGSAPAQKDLAGGHVDVLFDNAAAILGLATSGAVRALGITTPDRYRLAPEFPPVAEAVPGYVAMGWTGLAVSAGTPAAIRDEIENFGISLVQEPATVKRLSGVLSEPVGAGRTAFAAFLSEERRRWGALIADLKLRL